MTNENQNLKKLLMQVRFVMWDLHLYLDSHPCDKTALSLLERYRAKYNCLLKDYEKVYGPLTPSTGHGSDWTKGPWPWDNRGDC